MQSSQRRTSSLKNPPALQLTPWKSTQGIVGLASGNVGWLSLHMVLGGLAAAALTAHDAANFALLEFRCRLTATSHGTDLVS